MQVPPPQQTPTEPSRAERLRFPETKGRDMGPVPNQAQRRRKERGRGWSDRYGSPGEGAPGSSLLLLPHTGPHSGPGPAQGRDLT